MKAKYKEITTFKLRERWVTLDEAYNLYEKFTRKKIEFYRFIKVYNLRIL